MHRRRFTSLLVLVGLAVLIAGLEGLHRLASGIIADFAPLIGHHPVIAASVYVALSAISAMLSFFSSAVLVPVAVHAWGGWITLLLHWSGSLLGGAGAYVIGRRLGRPIARALVGEGRIAYWGARVGEGASFGVVLLFQLALQSEIPGYVLGTVRYPFRIFFGALALGSLPYAIGMVYMGVFFLDRRPLPLLLLAAVAIALIAWALRLLHRALRTSGPCSVAGPS